MKTLLGITFAASVAAGTLFGNGSAGQNPFGSGSWSASAGYGYKENVLSSEVAPVDAGFTYLSVEGAAKRDIVSSGAEWTNMLLYDRRDYSGVADMSAEAFGFLLSEYSKHLTVDGKLTAGIQYVYFNQPFDASFDIVDTQIKVQNAREPEFHLKWEALAWELGYAARLGLSEMSFKNLNNDYDALNWELEIDYELNSLSRLVASVDGFERDYQDRLGKSKNGVTLDGTLLSTTQTGFEAGIEWEPDFFGMENTVELGFDLEERRDEQFGYYDRDRLKYGLEWDIEGEKWNVRAELFYSESDYSNQLGGDGRQRSTDEWLWEVQVERKLTDKWTFFMLLERDESDSNEAFFTYDSNSALLGFRWR